MEGIAVHHNTLLKKEADKVRETESKWCEEVAQCQALQKAVKEWEEQLAKAHLEYEDRVHREEAKRVALEAQLQAMPNTSTDFTPHPTPQDRSTQSSTHGSRSSHRSR